MKLVVGAVQGWTDEYPACDVAIGFTPLCVEIYPNPNPNPNMQHCILPTVYFQLYFGTTNVTLDQATNIASITREQIRHVSVLDYFITVNL